MYGDKGYISKDLFLNLYNKGLKLFTNIRKDMKNYLFETQDKVNLRKRSLIESVFNVFKSNMKFEHTRHRSPINFLLHVLACVNAYSLKFLSFIDSPLILTSRFIGMEKPKCIQYTCGVEGKITKK